MIRWHFKVKSCRLITMLVLVLVSSILCVAAGTTMGVVGPALFAYQRDGALLWN